MTRTQIAFLWAAFILTAALLSVALDLPATSTGILITTLTIGAATSLNAKQKSACKKG